MTLRLSTKRQNAANMLDFCIARYGLVEKGFKRGPFTRSKTAAGITTHYPDPDNPQVSGGGMIRLSGPCVDVMSIENIKLTILHEIAHALLPPWEGHSARWAECCREIGGDGKQYVAAEDVPIRSKFTGTCENGHAFRAHRTLKNMNHRVCGQDRTRITWVRNY